MCSLSRVLSYESALDWYVLAKLPCLYLFWPKRLNYCFVLCMFNLSKSTMILLFHCRALRRKERLTKQATASVLGAAWKNFTKTTRTSPPMKRSQVWHRTSSPVKRWTLWKMRRGRYLCARPWKGCQTATRRLDPIWTIWRGTFDLVSNAE